jgi:hypothetical protein
MDRRQFSLEAAWILLGGATVAIVGCGGGASSPVAASTPSLTDAVGTVGTNHGHSAVIAAALLGAGDALELDIRGTSGHTHTLTLTAVEVDNVRRGMRFEKESSGSSHTHMVVFNG